MWSDACATWHHTAEIKIPAEIDVELVLEEGALLLERAAKGVPPKAGRKVVAAAAKACRDRKRPPEARAAPPWRPTWSQPWPRIRCASSSPSASPSRCGSNASGPFTAPGTSCSPAPRARSWIPTAGARRAGTFAHGAAPRLPAVAAMGFDVLYLPPIHPIGRPTARAATTLCDRGPRTRGHRGRSASDEGGHDAVHPDLGTLADFGAFVPRRARQGIEVALDFALQGAPDHPWVTAHPEWFTTCPDGSIAYAENPPKKYQDIYPINFDNDPEGIRARRCACSGTGSARA